MKTVLLPTNPLPVCGHSSSSYGGGDLMIGREESLSSIVSNGVRYIVEVEYGSCSKCNKAQDDIVKKRVAAYEEEQKKLNYGRFQ